MPTAVFGHGEQTGNTGPTVGDFLERLQAWSLEGKEPETTGRDGFPQYANDPLASIHQQLDTFLREIPSPGVFQKNNADTLPTGSVLLKQRAEDLALVVRAILVRVSFLTKDRIRPASGLDSQLEAARLRTDIGLGGAKQFVQGEGNDVMDPVEFRPLMVGLLSSRLPLTEDDLTHIIRINADCGGEVSLSVVPPEAALQAVEWFAETFVFSLPLWKELQRWKQSLGTKAGRHSPNRKLLARINLLLWNKAAAGIQPGETWSNAATEDLNQMSAEERTRWCKLFQHCQLVINSKRTPKWIKAANDCVEAIDREEFKARILQWFELVALPRSIHQEPKAPGYSPYLDQPITDGNSVILKGLVWACAEWEDAEVTRSLSRLAQVCFKNLRNKPLSARIGNACIHSLSATSTDEAVAELTRLNQVIKRRDIKKLTGKSLDKTAELTGQAREDLEESTIPAYGLDAKGCLKQAFGDFTAEFHVSGREALRLLWRKADGSLQKSVPAEVKKKHAGQLKSHKRTIQAIEKMLSAQHDRIERLLLHEREWGFDRWQERYLTHPLLANISRRLIWSFQQDHQAAAGIWHDGKIVDHQGCPLDWLSPKTRVRLWHPLGQELEAVASWRRWLETHLVTQPFKQAHREVYILTDAEQQTGTYSNRFAAHIIRQHQFGALAKRRGWVYRLEGPFDSINTPFLTLANWNLGVSFWVNPCSEETLGVFYRHLSTDQVRFTDLTGAARPLIEVPPLVFSEVMRDVDLFVGVCSIANDPGWQDRGEAGSFGDYWHRHSFGDLSVSAKIRREALERMLPRLKIAGQSSLQGNFLVVRGTLRTYKIHLGSGNILMEPNDQHLCIVPDLGRASPFSNQGIFLPFEGDNTLSVVLSKAFLLASDSKIKDQTIVRQIRQHGSA